MTAQKHADQASSRSSTATAAVTASQSQRKPWKKKTPVEVVLDQINRLRDDVLAREEELKQAKRQLQKLEEAKKVLEAT
jgi:predicted patatin/cPLA2 family phospholipase